jgi:alkyl hydroperoxide reductase subunit F
MYDLAILGAGPGGLTAAVYAARKELKVILIARDIGGQTTLTADIENYMGFEIITGADLAARFHEQVAHFPIDQRIGRIVTGIEPLGEHFRMETDAGEVVEARAVVISTGKRSKPLGIEAEQRLRGRGVSYCSICDGPLYRGLRVAVIGGGNSAVTSVLDLISIAAHITIVNVVDSWQADPILLERARRSDKIDWILGHKLVNILGEEEVRAILIEPRDGGVRREIPVEGVFVNIGLTPNTGFLKGFVELNDWGEVIVDCRSRTSRPGVFAAGDVTDAPDKQIIVAAGEGAKAALVAYEYLMGIDDPRKVRGW